jgi:hypothetical protein
MIGDLGMKMAALARVRVMSQSARAATVSQVKMM